MTVPRPIIPAPRGLVVTPEGGRQEGGTVDRVPEPVVAPVEPPLDIPIEAIDREPKPKRPRAGRPPTRPHEATRKRENIPGHEIYLAICQRVGSDPTAMTKVTIDGKDSKTANRLRINFYTWRAATRRELGEDFALDNHLYDTRIYLDPVLDKDGNILRGRRKQPVASGRVTFYSIRATPEVEALSAALSQLGVTP